MVKGRIYDDIIKKAKAVVKQQPFFYELSKERVNMNITVIAVGKISEKYLNTGLEEYKKRLSRYCKLNIVEVPDIQEPKNPSPLRLEEIKAKEGKNILKHIRGNNYMIALDGKGRKMSSEEMAAYIQDLSVMGGSSVTFIIGGSNGLSKEVMEIADMRLSFSDMTFPHRLMRLILLEQIYRWFKINKNERYHK